MALAEIASSSPPCNLAAALFRLENSREPADVQRVLQALVDWLYSPGDDAVRRAFLLWLKRVLLPGRLPGVGVPEVQTLEEMQAMLAEQVREWTRQWKEEGREEGRTEGREEGRREAERQALANDRALLLRLARKRFAEATVQTLAAMSVVATALERLLQADGQTTVCQVIGNCTTFREAVNQLDAYLQFQPEQFDRGQVNAQLREGKLS
jgi:hypothetical protein